MIRHAVHEPSLIWVVLFAYLCTQLSWPANTWRSVVVFVCWVVCLVMLILRFIA